MLSPNTHMLIMSRTLYTASESQPAHNRAKNGSILLYIFFSEKSRGVGGESTNHTRSSLQSHFARHKREIKLCSVAGCFHSVKNSNPTNKVNKMRVSGKLSAFYKNC